MIDSIRYRTSVTSRRGLGAALLVSALAALPSQILPLVLGAMTDELGFDALETSWLASADLVGVALAAATGVLWVSRIDLYVAAVAGAVAFLAGNLAVLLVLDQGGFWTLMLPRFVAGLGAGLMNAAAMAALGRHPNMERAFGLNLVAVVLLASTSYTALPAWLERSGIVTAFVLLTSLGTVSLAVCVRWFPDTPVPGNTDGAPASRGDSPPPLPPLRTTVVGLASFLFTASMMALWAYMERIGVSAGLSLVQVGSLMAFGFLASSATCFLASWQGNRYGRRLPLVISVMGMVVALALLRGPDGGGRYWLYFGAGVLLYSSMWNYAIPFKSAVVARLDPHGRLLVLFVAVNSLAGAAGPVLGGFIAADGAYGRVVIWSGLAFALAVFVYVALDGVVNPGRRRRASGRPPPASRTNSPRTPTPLLPR